MYVGGTVSVHFALVRPHNYHVHPKKKKQRKLNNSSSLHKKKDSELPDLKDVTIGLREGSNLSFTLHSSSVYSLEDENILQLLPATSATNVFRGSNDTKFLFTYAMMHIIVNTRMFKGDKESALDHIEGQIDFPSLGVLPGYYQYVLVYD